MTADGRAPGLRPRRGEPRRADPGSATRLCASDEAVPGLRDEPHSAEAGSAPGLRTGGEAVSAIRDDAGPASGVRAGVAAEPRSALAKSIRAHIETWRPYTLWYIGLVGLGGAALQAGPHHPWRLAAAWAAPTAGWIGGHYLGDFFDRELDAIAKPHRPIPSGRLSPRTAVRCGCACLAVATALAVSGGWWTTTTVLVGMLGIVAYSRWLKARGILGNLVRGALGAIALLYGALSVHAHISTQVLAFIAVFWLHDTMSNLVGTLRDIDGDRAGGYRTLPVRRGSTFAVATVFVLYAATLGAALTGGLPAARSGRAAFLITLMAVGVLGAAALAPLVKQRAAMPVGVALRAHSVLVLERVVLASAVVGLGLGVGWQLGLLAPLALLTWRTQAAMRPGHELGRT